MKSSSYLKKGHSCWWKSQQLLNEGPQQLEKWPQQVEEGLQLRVEGLQLLDVGPAAAA
jgi:hypothetical protein